MSSFDVVLDGGSADALVAATYLARRGARPLVVARGVRELATESFLTPHRFDLGLGFLLRGASRPDVLDELADGLALAEPAVPLAVERPGAEPFRLHRDWRATAAQLAGEAERERLGRLARDGAALRSPTPGEAAQRVAREHAERSVRELLDAYGLRDGALRAALTYLPLAFGLAVEGPGTGLAVPVLLAGLERFAAVEGGAGVLAARLADAIVARGGAVGGLRDGASDALRLSPPPRPAHPVGLARVFAGGHAHVPPEPPGHLTVVGLSGEDAVYARLDGRAGLGHVRVRSEPDPAQPGTLLVSAVWQGPCPSGGAPARAAAEACVRVAGLRDAAFQLPWTPADTGAALEVADWAAPADGRWGSAAVSAAAGLEPGRTLAASVRRWSA